MLPSACTMLSLSKHRNTWIMASVSVCWPKLVAKAPSPLLAPLPIGDVHNFNGSRNNTFGVYQFLQFHQSVCRALTTPILGSMVQNGKLALWALALDKQLKGSIFSHVGQSYNSSFHECIFKFWGCKIYVQKSLQLYFMELLEQNSRFCLTLVKESIPIIIGKNSIYHHCFTCHFSASRLRKIRLIKEETTIKKWSPRNRLSLKKNHGKRKGLREVEGNENENQEFSEDLK